RQLLDLVENSDLNAMVIDIKEDYGHLTFVPDQSSPYKGIDKDKIKNMKNLMKTIEEKKIYSIVRGVVFKVSFISQECLGIKLTYYVVLMYKLHSYVSNCDVIWFRK